MFDGFLSYLRYELNRSPNTVEAYGRDLEQFAQWLNPVSNRQLAPASITSSDIRAWLASRASTDTATTLRRKTQSLRSFFRWMMRRHLIDANPAADVVLAKKPKRLPEFVRESDMEKILEIPSSNSADNSSVAPGSPMETITELSFEERRDHLIINILYSTGIRQAELLGLKDSDISFSSAEAKVTGKRNKQRVIPLPQPLLDEIREWIRVRDSRNERFSPQPLFPGRCGPMSKSQLYGIVRRMLSSASSQARSPHVLRHSFATAMLNHGANLDSVREMLGHSSLATTEIYTHLSFDQLKAAYRTAHPRSKNKNK